MESYAAILGFLFISFLTSFVRYCKAVKEEKDGVATWYSITMFVFFVVLIYSGMKLVSEWNMLI